MMTLKQPTEVTFPFHFNYLLTEKGQRTHLLSGGDGKESQRIAGEISLADAEALGIRFSDGRLTSNSADLRTGHWNKYTGRFQQASYDQALTFEHALGEALKFRVLQLEWFAAEKAAKEAAKQAALAGQATITNPSGYTDGRKLEIRHDDCTFTFENDPELSALYVRQQQQRTAAEEAARQAKAAEEAAREQAKADQIAAWVAEHGTDDQKERLAAGLFPRDEAVQAIKERAFTPGAELALYDRITKGEIEHEEDCRSGWDGDWDMDCESDEANTVTAEEWAKLKAVKALFPGAVECVIKRHKCTCDQCHEGISRSGIYVKLQAGAFTFNREFAL